MMVINTRRLAIYFLFLFFVSYAGYFLASINLSDHVWVYGNVLKIVEGLLPYRDFNLITTPFYYYLLAAFVKLTNENILFFWLGNAFLSVTLYYLFYRICIKLTQVTGYSLWLTQMVAIYTALGLVYYSYNLLVAIFILLIIYQELKLFEQQRDSIKGNIIIGLLLGLILLTKHSSGVVTCFFSLLFVLLSQSSRQQKLKMLGYRILMFSVVGIAFVAYLYITGSLVAFIDYCFLGLMDFQAQNSSISTVAVIYGLPMFILLIQGGIRLIKERKNEQTTHTQLLIVFIYAVSALPNLNPIFDLPHEIRYLLPAFLLMPMLYPEKQEKFKGDGKIGKKYFIILLAILFLYGGLFTANYTDVKWNRDSAYPYFRYTIIRKEFQEYINTITAYIKHQESLGNQVIVVDPNAMAILLSMGRVNYPYNYLIRGNLGKNGEQRISEQFRKLPENTLFMLKSSFINQDVTQLKAFIRTNGTIVDSVIDFEVYRLKPESLLTN